MAYLLERRHGALFWKMRLGKTLVVIRRLLALKCSPPRFLVVAPYDALTAWQLELEREGETDVCWLTGTRAERLAKLTEQQAKWCLLNKEGHLTIGEEVAMVPWDAVVLDESTFVKNPRAKVSKFFCTHFRGVPHRYILTGMPNPESDLDFFQQFLFLDNGHTFQCRNYWTFRSRRFTPMAYDWVPVAGTLDFIRTRVGENASVLSRKDVHLENPRVYEQRVLELPRELRKVYRTVENEFVLEYAGVDRKTDIAGVKHNWLRELCGGFIEGREVWSGKVDVVKDLLSGELKGEQVVVWAHYNQELHALRSALKDYHCSLITGATPPAKRAELFTAFRAGRIRVLLIQPACVKFGVDLSAASTAIYYSTPLSHEVRVQSEDRILRVGDGHPLLFIDLVVKDTVDEDCLDLLKEKKLRTSATLWLARRMKERVGNAVRT